MMQNVPSFVKNSISTGRFEIREKDNISHNLAVYEYRLQLVLSATSIMMLAYDSKTYLFFQNDIFL